MKTKFENYYSKGKKKSQLALFLYAVMACAKMLDTAARIEDCRVACTMGDGAMISVDCTILRFLFFLLLLFSLRLFRAFAVSDARQALDMVLRLEFYQISMRGKQAEPKRYRYQNTNPRAVKICCGVRVPPGYGNPS